MRSLATYLESTGISQNEFARRIGTSGAAVCRWVSGKRTPTAQWAFAIERATKGKVPMRAWAGEARNGSRVTQ